MKTSTALKLGTVGILITLSSVFNDAKAQVIRTSLRASETLQKAKLHNNQVIAELNATIEPLTEQHEVLSAALITKLELDSARADSTTYQQAFNSWFAKAKDKNAFIESTDIPKRDYNQHKEELWALEDSTKVNYLRLDEAVKEIEHLNDLIARKADGTPLSTTELQQGIEKLEVLLQEPLAELEESYATAGRIDSTQTVYAQAVSNLEKIASNISQITKLEEQKLAVAHDRTLKDGQRKSKNELIEADINAFKEANEELRDEYNNLARKIASTTIVIAERNYTQEVGTELEGTESQLDPDQPEEDNYLRYILDNGRN